MLSQKEKSNFAGRHHSRGSCSMSASKRCSRAKSDVQLMHYVYVLRSLKDRGFYIGYSANFRKRFNVSGGSFATSHRGPWQLIYYEGYLNQADALGRESDVKVLLRLCVALLKENQFYVGWTRDLLVRVQQHSSGLVISTKKRAPFELVYGNGALTA
jgi:putative endonuclease